MKIHTKGDLFRKEEQRVFWDFLWRPNASKLVRLILTEDEDVKGELLRSAVLVHQPPTMQVM